MPEEPRRILEIAGRGARAAARLCRAVLDESGDRVDAMSKVAREPVTVADYGSQALILREVAAAFPDHGVISEEGAEHLRENAGEAGVERITRLVSAQADREVGFDELCGWIDHEGRAGAEFVWAIDPIDGTKGFVRRDQFAVAVGVLREGEPWAGALACPNLPWDPAEPGGTRGVLFLALKDAGATMEPLDGSSAPRPAKASAHTGPGAVRIMGSVESSHGDPRLLTLLREELGLTTDVVRIDSQAKYGAVSRGEAEIYLRPRSRPDYRENIWDHAAGVILVLEAGGRVTDLDGKPLDFSLGKKLDENRGVLATNGAVHDRVLACLQQVESRV